MVAASAVLSVTIGLVGAAPADASPRSVAHTTRTLSTTDTTGLPATDRDEFSNTYTKKDGTHVSEISAMPVNVYTSNGWQESKTTLEPDATTGDLQVAANQNVLHPRFKQDGSADDVMSVERDGYTVSYSLVGAAKAAAKHSAKAADRVSYAGALSGADLEYQVQPASVKETLTLRTVPKSPSPSYTFKVKAPNLTLSMNAEGGVDFTDSNGTVRFRVPTPVMWDSSSAAGEASSTSVNVPVTVEKTGSSWKLTLTPSHEWLVDPARVYPVMLDPTTSPGWDAVKSIKSDGTVRTDALLIGNPNDTGYKYWRGFAHFPLTGVFGKQILSAYQHVYLHGADGDGTVRSGNIYWANQIAYTNGAGPLLASFNVGTAADSTGDALAQNISNWVNAGNNSPWLELIGQETPSTYTIKNLWTNLYITWADYPSTPTAAAPSPTGGARAILTPTLAMTSSDPTGTGLSYWYRIATGSDAETNVAWNSGWVSDNPATVPAGVLQPNTTYYYHLYVRDGYCNNTQSNSCSTRVSSVYSFVTNPRAITAPAAGAVIGGNLPTITGTGDAGASITVTSGGSTVCTGTVADDGTWGCRASTPMPDGPVSFTASESGSATVSMTPVAATLKRPTTTLSCPAPYTNKSWTSTVPATPITCTVTTDAHGVAGVSLGVSLNGQSVGGPISVAASGTTTSQVTIPNQPGWYDINVAPSSDGGDTTPTTVAFGLQAGAPSALITAIQRVLPEAFEGVTAGPTTSTGPVAVQTTTADSSSGTATVSTDPAAGVTITTDAQTQTDPTTGATTTTPASTVTAQLPTAATASDAHVEATGIVSFDNHNSSHTVTIVKQDTSVQNFTIIDNNTAPAAYSYPLQVPAGSSLSLDPATGMVWVTAADGTQTAGLSPAWAKDANGADVPTNYTINGNTVTQHIDHTAPTITYPVVADPWMGKQIFSSVKVRNQSHGGAAGPWVEIVTSLWGRLIQTGYAQGGGLWGFGAGQLILKNAGWSELKAKALVVASKATYRQQYECHVLGAYTPVTGGPAWDLEGGRSSRPNWRYDGGALPPTKCNWK